MLDNFYKDLQIGHRAEDIVLNTYSALDKTHTYTNVAENREDFYRGDIKATDSAGKVSYIEVKNDSRIGQTHNILCEDYVYYYEKGKSLPGNMHNSRTDLYAVVSEDTRTIYLFNFKILQANYKKGKYKVIPHPDQDTYCYLCSLDMAKEWGALINIVNY